MFLVAVEQADWKNSLINENIQTVLGYVERSPAKSKGSPRERINFLNHSKFLKKSHFQFQLWKSHFVLEIYIEDCDSQMEYRENLLQWSEKHPDLWNNIFWSVEAVFNVGGLINRRNCLLHAENHPGSMWQKMKLNKTGWCDFTKDKFADPLCFARQWKKRDNYWSFSMTLDQLSQNLSELGARWSPTKLSLCYFEIGLVRISQTSGFGRGGPQFCPAQSSNLHIMWLFFMEVGERNGILIIKVKNTPWLGKELFYQNY